MGAILKWNGNLWRSNSLWWNILNFFRLYATCNTLASISGVKPIYVFTHDSIGLGEDGPTHQPIEHLASLRAIPKVVVIRPADANETVEAWKFAIEHKGSPVALALTRQKVPVLDRTKFASAENLLKGAYILVQSEKNPQVILMASGSEVSLAVEASNVLQSEGIKYESCQFSKLGIV